MGDKNRRTVFKIPNEKRLESPCTTELKSVSQQNQLKCKVICQSEILPAGDNDRDVVIKVMTRTSRNPNSPVSRLISISQYKHVKRRENWDAND
jgi:ribosomal protein S12